jgi:hypothetical protein
LTGYHDTRQCDCFRALPSIAYRSGHLSWFFETHSVECSERLTLRKRYRFDNAQRPPIVICNLQTHEKEEVGSGGVICKGKDNRDTVPRESQPLIYVSFDPPPRDTYLDLGNLVPRFKTEILQSESAIPCRGSFLSLAELVNSPGTAVVKYDCRL